MPTKLFPLVLLVLFAPLVGCTREHEPPMECSDFTCPDGQEVRSCVRPELTTAERTLGNLDVCRMLRGESPTFLPPFGKRRNGVGA